MSKGIKTVLRTLFLVVVSLILGVNLYLWNAQSLTGNALPMPFGYGAAVVLTGSMEPTIMVDDLILVREQDDYEVDDIVVYQSGNMLVVHRIVELDEENVVTKGDANNAADAPVPRTLIKGEVFGTVPNVGGLVRLLKTPTVSILLVVAAVGLLELSYRKEKEKGDDELEKIKAEIRRLKDGTEPEE